jgi:hypothetical protein
VQAGLRRAHVPLTHPDAKRRSLTQGNSSAEVELAERTQFGPEAELTERTQSELAAS